MGGKPGDSAASPVECGTLGWRAWGGERTVAVGAHTAHQTGARLAGCSLTSLPGSHAKPHHSAFGSDLACAGERGQRSLETNTGTVRGLMWSVWFFVCLCFGHVS